MLRLGQLIQEVVVTVPRHLIAEAVDVIVYIEGRGEARRIGAIANVVGLEGQGYRLEPV